MKCEGCDKPMPPAETIYVTDDDVRLCKECYDAVPVVGGLRLVPKKDPA